MTTITTNTKKTTRKRVAKTAPATTEQKVTKAAKPESTREVHGLSGAPSKSSGFTKRKSRTAVASAEEFGTKSDMVLTSRREEVLNELKGKYGKKPFKRLDADAAILSAGVRKGLLKPVNGDLTSPDGTYQFV